MYEKKISAYISKIALEFTSKRYENVIKSYIQKFNNTDEIPLFKMVNIETINRCNGKCSFCPANIRDEQRELKRMSDYIFEKIIMGLKKLSWGGKSSSTLIMSPF